MARQRKGGVCLAGSTPLNMTLRDTATSVRPHAPPALFHPADLPETPPEYLSSHAESQIKSYTVKPVLTTTCLRRPPVFKGHDEKSLQTAISSNLPKVITCLEQPTTTWESPRGITGTVYRAHFFLARGWSLNTSFTVYSKTTKQGDSEKQPDSPQR